MTKNRLAVSYQLRNNLIEKYPFGSIVVHYFRSSVMCGIIISFSFQIDGNANDSITFHYSNSVSLPLQTSRLRCIHIFCIQSCDSCTFRSTCSLGTSGVACNCTHRSTADRINNTCHTSHEMHFPERAISSEFSQLHPLLAQKARIPDGSLSHNSRTKREAKATGNGSRVAERDAENFTAENSRRLGLRLVEVRIETHGKLRLVSVSAKGNEENSSPCPHTKFHTIFTAPPATTFPVPCVSPNSRRCELPLGCGGYCGFSAAHKQQTTLELTRRTRQLCSRKIFTGCPESCCFDAVRSTWGDGGALRSRFQTSHTKDKGADRDASEPLPARWDLFLRVEASQAPSTRLYALFPFTDSACIRALTTFPGDFPSSPLGVRSLFTERCSATRTCPTFLLHNFTGARLTHDTKTRRTTPCSASRRD